MKTILFALPGNEQMTSHLAQRLDAEKGLVTIRSFPDGETYVRILSDVKGKHVVLVCTLYRPDDKLLPLYFLSKNARDLGAQCTCLMAPYLAYMRQDKRFKKGEAVTSEYFARLISNMVDALFTVDPHLHRRTTLSEIYSIPCEVVHAAAFISSWIKNNVSNPLLVGPDVESEQWVTVVAEKADAPFVILEKKRYSDKHVEVSLPNVENFNQCTPVLIDDIISTARTMIETVRHLKSVGLSDPVCIGVHAIFAGSAYQELRASGVARIVTCNTISHESNEIDISDLLASHYLKLWND